MRRDSPRLVGVLLALSWIGLVVHNFVESVDGSSFYVGVVAAIFFLIWKRYGMHRGGARLLFSWGVAFLVAAIVTVIPFDFLPFSPPQTLTHYLAHVLWGAVQIPLIVVMLRELRAAPPEA